MSRKITSKSFLEKYWIAVALTVFVVLFIVLYFFFAKINTVEYQGLTFIKEKYKDFNLYHYTYYYTEEGQTYKNNVYLRNDPRDNEIPVYGEISFDRGKTIYIGFNNTGINTCPDSQLALGTLIEFLRNNQFKPKFGTVDLQEAIEKNQSWVTCNNYANNTVITLSAANGTSQIIKSGKYCYEIKVNPCDDVLPGVEKFITQSLIDAKSSSLSQSS